MTCNPITRRAVHCSNRCPRKGSIKRRHVATSCRKIERRLQAAVARFPYLRTAAFPTRVYLLSAVRVGVRPDRTIMRRLYYLLQTGKAHVRELMIPTRTHNTRMHGTKHTKTPIAFYCRDSRRACYARGLQSFKPTGRWHEKKEPGNYRGQTGKHDPPGRLTDGQAATERSGRRAN